jgi:multidrug transporter EmrE-like cation transporter
MHLLAFIILFLATFFEIAWGYYLQKQSYFLYCVTMFACMGFTIAAGKYFPVAVLYPCLIGLGTLGALTLNYYVFKQPFFYYSIGIVVFILLTIWDVSKNSFN